MGCLNPPLAVIQKSHLCNTTASGHLQVALFFFEETVTQVTTPRPLDPSINAEDIVTDYGGLPLTKEAVRALRDKCNKHLRMAPWRLAEYGNHIIETKHPHMAPQLKYHREDFE